MLFDRLKNKEVKVIDIGCGNGLFTRAIASSFKTIISIDINTKRVNNLEQFCIGNGINNVYVQEMNAYNILFADSEFDLAVFYRSIDHIPDYRRALCEANRVLKRKGQIYINIADVRRKTEAIKTMDALRDFEDELFDYLGTSEGMCEIKPISIMEIKGELEGLGFENIQEQVNENEEAQNEAYYQRGKEKIEELLRDIKTRKNERYDEFVEKYHNLEREKERTGIEIRPTVEIVGEKRA